MSTITDLLDPPYADLEEQLPEGRYEFVNGQIVEKPSMGANADRIATRLMTRLDIHAEAQGLGQVFGAGCGYQCFEHERRRVRYPDVSFISAGRLADGDVPDGHVRIAPDLAVELISPHDKAYNVEERLTDVLRAGVPLAWHVYPSTRHVMVFRQGPDCTRLAETDTLDGEDVLPGFSCKVADLFPKPKS